MSTGLNVGKADYAVQSRSTFSWYRTPTRVPDQTVLHVPLSWQHQLFSSVLRAGGTCYDRCAPDLITHTCYCGTNTERCLRGSSAPPPFRDSRSAQHLVDNSFLAPSAGSDVTYRGENNLSSGHLHLRGGYTAAGMLTVTAPCT